MILVYITCQDKEEAQKISRHLLEKRLIACTNVSPIESFYWWDEKITHDQEVVLLGKTTEEKFEEIKAEVEKIHSYDIPCILGVGVKSNEKYERWVEREVS